MFTKLYTRNGRGKWEYDINLMYKNSYKVKKHAELIEKVEEIEKIINKQLEINLKKSVDHNIKLFSAFNKIEDEDFSVTLACDRNGNLLNSKDKKAPAQITFHKEGSRLVWNLNKSKKLTDKEKIVITSVMDSTVRFKNIG